MANISSNHLDKNGMGYVDVRFIADSLQNYFYKYVDIFFKDREYPDRLIFHGFINKI